MESHNAECLGDEFELLGGIILAVIVAAILGFLVGTRWNTHKLTKAEIISKLDAADKQRIAIDFEKANGSWRRTLHNPCNFSPMDADKETK